MLKRFMVGLAKAKFKAVDSKFMINITHHTTIEKYSGPLVDIPLCVYRLRGLSDVSSLVGEDKFFIG